MKSIWIALWFVVQPGGTVDWVVAGDTLFRNGSTFAVHRTRAACERELVFIRHNMAQRPAQLACKRIVFGE